MIELLQNPEKRKLFSNKGKIRAKEFSWRKMAEQTLSTYQETYKIWKEKQI